MEVHRFEKVWVALAIVLILGFVTTIVYGSAVEGVSMVNEEGGTIDPAAVGNGTTGTGFDDPGVRQVGDGEYDAYVMARQFNFNPGNMTVPAGSTVTFYVTSPDVIHGFNVVGTNVNTMVIPGQIAEMTVQFDEPGVYGIVCHEYCGAGHHNMEGRLNVVPASQFDASGGNE